ncbi:hypothetical protein SO802_012652 [Lithocarpus litseifolius]|uniref:Transmembrane 9 superfamily member n=1 Tax=Lithocarpus litseifolius TaxID=425828 RepID=A0AAW2D8T5_9ROSI
MGKLVAIILSAIVVMCCGSQVRSDAIDHRYKAGDLVPLYVNKIGPFANPSETYRYFDLPFCSPDYVKEKKATLGEVLNGDRLVSAPYKLEFLLEKYCEVVCRKNLTREEVSQFRTAIKRDYYFQMYYDDLPMWVFIGKIDRLDTAGSNERFFLYKHLKFNIFFNKDRVIEVNAQMDNRHVVDLTEDKELLVEFVYTVKWRKQAVRNLLIAGCLFSGPLLFTFCLLQIVAISYKANAALPFGTILVLILLLTFVAFPLLVLGGIFGKNSQTELQTPCHTTKCPRDIPPLRWYRGFLPQMALAGFLPFSAVYIETYYILASVWGHRIYTIYSILFIIFIILLIATALVTVALTYFQLAAEDHQWWWRIGYALVHGEAVGHPMAFI